MPSPPLAPVSCEERRANALSFEHAVVVNNNLGGYGPQFNDPRELRITNLHDNGKTFDVVVTNVTEYYGVLNHKVNTNGVEGIFAHIGLSYGKTVFRMRFVDVGSYAPLVMEDGHKFEMTVFDFDRGNNKVLPGGTGKKCAEMVGMSKPNFAAHYGKDSKELKVEDMGQNVIVTGRKSAGGNMETEWYMTEQEKAKAFPFSTELNDFQITFGMVDDVYDPTYCSVAEKGRWWQFAGYSPAHNCIVG